MSETQSAKAVTLKNLNTSSVGASNHAPVFSNGAGAFAGAVTEAGSLDNGNAVAGKMTATGTLKATDVDAGDTQSWSIAGTPSTSYGAIVIDAATGKWTYTLDNNLLATQALKVNQTVIQTYTARVTDQFGAFVEHVVTVTITGTNDAPVIINDAGAFAGAVTEAGILSGGSAVAGTPTATGQMTATDVDGAVRFWSIVGTPSTSYGAIAIDQATGQWTYTLDNTATATQALKENQTVTQIFTARVTDESGAHVEQQVTVMITGTNDAPVISNGAGAFAGAVTEAGNLDNGNAVAGKMTATGTLKATDVDAGDTQTWSIEGTPSATYGAIAIDSSTGKWTYTLDNDLLATQALKEGQTVTQTFTARVTDEFGEHDEQTVTVTIRGTNDAPVMTSAAQAGAVTEAGSWDNGNPVAGTQTATGQLTADDGDAGATRTWSIAGTPSASYGAIAIDEATGEWTYTLDNSLAATQALKENQTVTQTFTARVTDEFGAHVEQQVTVTITGTNDAPVFGIAPEGAVQEEGTLTASGNVVSSDGDRGATATYSGDALSSYGSFAINAKSGAWTYTLNNAAAQSLAEGETHQDIFKVTVTDDKGAIATQDVVLNIAGSNDAPVITAEDLTGAVTEQVAPGTDLTDSGTISFTDLDLTDTHSISAVTPDAFALGTLSAIVSTEVNHATGLGGAVTWHYSVADSAVEYLAAGETRSRRSASMCWTITVAAFQKPSA